MGGAGDEGNRRVRDGQVGLGGPCCLGVVPHHPPTLQLGGSCTGSAHSVGTAGGEGVGDSLHVNVCACVCVAAQGSFVPEFYLH